MAAAALSGFVGGVKTRLAVEAATTNSNDEPTPIYVLDELVQSLGAGDTRAGVDAVCARLTHRSPVVKQKALKLVTHIGRKGSPDLRRLMARQSGAVRELLHFRCDPDPFKGDTVWKRVQEYAQEALNAVHGAPEATVAAAGGMGGQGAGLGQQGTLGGRIEGFGSGAGGGGGGSGGMRGFGSDSASSSSSGMLRGSGSGGGGGGAGRMVGFGSADVVQSGMQALSSGMRSIGRQTGALLRQDGYSSQLDGGGGGGISSARLGGSGGSGTLSQPIVQTSGIAPPVAVAAAGGGSSAAGTFSAAAATEQRLVDRICTPAGLRAAPSRDDTRAFVDGITSLDGPAVALLLQRKLEGGPWQATLRALCAIEAVVESGSSAACGQVAVHFQAHPEAVRRAADSPQASVRQRAQKVLALLGDPSAAAPAGSGSRSAGGGGSGGASGGSVAQLATEDLLGEAAEPPAAAALADLLGDPATSSAPAAAPTIAALSAPAATAAISSGGSNAADLLAGLDVPSAPPGQAAPTAAAAAPSTAINGTGAGAAAGTDPFAGMLLATGAGGQHVQAAPPQPPASAVDLLGGLSLSPAAARGNSSMPAAAAPRPAFQQQPAAPAPQSGGLDDLLGGLSPGGGGGSSSAGGMMPTHGGMVGSAGLGAPLQLQQHLGMPARQAVPGMGSFQPAVMMDGSLQQHQCQQHQRAPPAYQMGGGGGCGGGGGGGGGGMHFGGSTQQGGAGAHAITGTGAGITPTLLSANGVLGSSKDNSFNFVDDALAAARRKR